MIELKLPVGDESGSCPGFVVKRLSSLDSLYSFVHQCGQETLPQALDLYISQLEAVGLPRDVAADYMMVETLFAAARILWNSGCAEDILPENVTCPRFTAVEDGFTRCRAWSLELLQCALEYQNRYNGRGGNLGIARARYYIDRHYTDAELMLKDAAAEARMSPSRFSTVFAREMGRTFTEYVTVLRMRKACELLSETAMRIAQIAVRVGYNDPHYFSWIFRKTTGCTPTEFRERSDDR